MRHGIVAGGELHRALDAVVAIGRQLQLLGARLQLFQPERRGADELAVDEHRGAGHVGVEDQRRQRGRGRLCRAVRARPSSRPAPSLPAVWLPVPARGRPRSARAAAPVRAGGVAGALATGAGASGTGASRVAMKTIAPAATSRATTPMAMGFTARILASRHAWRGRGRGPVLGLESWGLGLGRLPSAGRWLPDAGSRIPDPGNDPPVTILCLASYHKGHDFIREAHRLGCRVLLVTSESLRDAAWPRECITRCSSCRTCKKQWKLEDLLARREPPRAPRADRSHRAAGRLRPGEGVGAARTPAGARHGRDHDALLPRQAGDAREGRERRGAGARPSSTCSTRRASAPSARRCRRPGCSSRVTRRAPSASARSRTKRRCGPRWPSWAMGPRTSCSNHSSPETSITSIPSSMNERCGWPWPASTARRPSMCHTAAGCSRPASSSAARRSSAICWS